MIVVTMKNGTKRRYTRRQGLQIALKVAVADKTGEKVPSWMRAVRNHVVHAPSKAIHA